MALLSTDLNGIEFMFIIFLINKEYFIKIIRSAISLLGNAT